jgi:hypothetical protein
MSKKIKATKKELACYLTLMVEMWLSAEREVETLKQDVLELELEAEELLERTGQ